MKTILRLCAILLTVSIAESSTYSQDVRNSPFENPGGSESDPGNYDLTDSTDQKADLNPVWLYVTTKADEISELGRLTHVELRVDAAVERRLSALITEYADQFYDHDIDRRIQRMCQSYEVGLRGMSAEESASIALQHLETGDELRARRKAVGDRFLQAVGSAFGNQIAEEVIREADAQASFVATYSIETTRDWIELHDLDKVGYMKNACNI